MNKREEKIKLIVPIAIVESTRNYQLNFITISNNLSKIFDSSDNQMSDGLLLMKIDSIINIFICAVVLFNSDIDHQMYANQNLNFPSSLFDLLCTSIVNSQFYFIMTAFEILSDPFVEKYILMSASHYVFLIFNWFEFNEF
jgi:hypothetical protein